MPSNNDIQSVALARGRAVRRKNALAAIIFGGALALILTAVFPFKFIRFGGGLLLGLVYANAFEYFFHRFLLHLPHGFLARQHLLHHSTWGTPDEARYVNFARTPWAVVLLFAVNSVLFIALDWVFRTGLASGVLIGFVLYFLAFEEIHWRIHLGGWLPSWLRFAARHHLLHHAGGRERFSVFLPVWDWLFERGKRELF